MTVAFAPTHSGIAQVPVPCAAEQVGGVVELPGRAQADLRREIDMCAASGDFAAAENHSGATVDVERPRAALDEVPTPEQVEAGPEGV